MMLTAFCACNDAGGEDTPPPPPQNETGEYYNTDGSFRRISADSKWGYLYGHPIFEGHGYEIYSPGPPAIQKAYRNMSIAKTCANTGEDPQIIVGEFNYLLDLHENGKLSVHKIYNDSEIAADKSKATPHITFLRGDCDKPVAIVAAGGGYSYVASTVEAFPYAKALNELGYNVAVLRYRVAGELGYDDNKELNAADKDECRKEGAKDMAQTVRYLLANENKFGISMENFTMFGSSAGGGLITLYSFSAFEENYRALGLPRPATINLIYTDRFLFVDDAGNELTFSERDAELYAYMVVGENDEIGGDIALDKKVPEMKAVMGDEHVNYTKYSDMRHGSGLAYGTSAEGWIYDAITYWQAHMRE